MLVLSRKESQRIRLGDSIVITIVKISGDKVRVGIDAPSSVLVLRDELEARGPTNGGTTTDVAPGNGERADSTPVLRQSA
jgi:carbon storage regulator